MSAGGLGLRAGGWGLNKSISQKDSAFSPLLLLGKEYRKKSTKNHVGSSYYELLLGRSVH